MRAMIKKEVLLVTVYLRFLNIIMFCGVVLDVDESDLARPIW
jgi:hypothetical protein